MAETWYLIDASGYIFRAYHALPPMTRADGTPVGAVFGFCNVLWKLEKELRARRILVVFDAARKTFRMDLYPDYKANRPPAPEDLIPQFPLFREAVAAFGLPYIEQEGYEADDLMATYATQLATRGDEVVLVSADKDLMQLVGGSIRMFDPMKNKNIGRDEVVEKFGVPPEQVVDVQALIGDSSDNIPGVPGIGVKTAAELMQTFGTLENLLANAGTIKQPKRRELLQTHADKARLSYQLATLKRDVPLDLPLENIGDAQTDWSTVRTFFEAQQFRSLLTRLNGKEGIHPTAPTVTAANNAPLPSPAPAAEEVKRDYSLVITPAALETWLEQARQQGFLAVDTETTGLDALKADIVGVSLALAPGKACYIPLGHSLLASGDGQIAPDTALALLKPLLEDDSILKIGHNIKYDMLVFSRYGIGVTPVDDTMVMSYALNSTRHGHGMDELAELYLGLKTITYDELTGTGRKRLPFADVPVDKAMEYAAEDADITLRLSLLFRQRLRQEGKVHLYESLDRPLVPVLAAMEQTGIAVDGAVLRQLSAEFAAGLQTLETQIYAEAGQPFNIASPKQLGDILFEAKAIPGGKKGKTGAYSTGVEVLEPLAAAGHALPRLVLDWRQLAKLKSTYTDALLQDINPKTGRIHTSFAQTLTSTGRLSSSNPNLQNIPVRTLEGRKIRTAFIAREGCTLLSLDYSQIELRLLAVMADIGTLQEAFAAGTDVHTLTAAQVFGLPLAEVTSDQRRRAKAVNFGIIYGISAFGLAQQLGCSQGEAKGIIEAYFRQYPGIQAYMQTTIETARRQGFVETLFSRQCHINGINDRNHALKQMAERAAINAPIQGTAADIMRKAMLLVAEVLPDACPDARMVLQVHDEVVIECPDDAATVAAVQHAASEAMVAAGTAVKVPLLVEGEAGKRWS